MWDEGNEKKVPALVSRSRRCQSKDLIPFLHLEELIDNRPLKKLEDNGFLQKTYAAYGVVR
jgi:hypothetical protein